MIENAANERRKPRSVFTRKLEEMCERLDAQSHFSITERHRWLRKTVTSQVEICDLWVVGSYARGAPECGDLDVLMRVKVDGAQPMPHKIAKEAFANMVDVRIYQGTPEQNSSGVPFTEAVHLWGPAINWREAIASIKEDPNAKRFARTTDTIPLRTEQLYAENEELEELVELRQQGILDWRFIPHGATPYIAGLSESEKRLVHLAKFWGKKTRELLPFLLAYVRQLHPPLNRIDQESGVLQLDVGGALLSVGRPCELDKQLDEVVYSRIAVAPHRSRRGPNGIWELRRGKNHPLELAAANLGAFVEVDEANVPCSCLYIGSAGFPEAFGIDLFATEKRARETMDEEGRPPPVALRHVCGSQLLDLISCADVVEIHHGTEEITTLALRRNGAAALREDDTIELSDTETAVATLKERLTIRSPAPADS